MYGVLVGLFIVVCVLLILVVLAQSGRSSDLELFSGGFRPGGGESDLLTKITTVLAILFMVGSLGLALYKSRERTIVEKKVEEIQKMQGTPTMAPSQPLTNIKTQTQNQK